MRSGSRTLRLWTVVTVTCLITGFFIGSEARYIRSVSIAEKHEGLESIPAFLLRVYDEMGRDNFRQTWKAFNNRSPNEQDAFLLDDLSPEELDTLHDDFEKLAYAISSDPKLMELYSNFERNLSIDSFMEMDSKLIGNQLWWGRIKRFLYRKLQKLAREMIVLRGQ